MRALDVIQAAHDADLTLAVDGDALVLEADGPPPTALLDLLAEHKSAVLSMLRPDAAGWTVEDWRTFFDERAGIAEFNAELGRDEAEVRAFECCVVEWLNRHPQHSLPGRCAWCGKPDRKEHVVVPFGVEGNGHTWLHPECWEAWHGARIAEATAALEAMGLRGLLKSPDDFGKNGGA